MAVSSALFNTSGGSWFCANWEQIKVTVYPRRVVNNCSSYGITSGDETDDDCSTHECNATWERRERTYAGDLSGMNHLCVDFVSNWHHHLATDTLHHQGSQDRGYWMSTQLETVDFTSFPLVKFYCSSAHLRSSPPAVVCSQRHVHNWNYELQVASGKWLSRYSPPISVNVAWVASCSFYFCFIVS